MLKIGVKSIFSVFWKNYLYEVPGWDFFELPMWFYRPKPIRKCIIFWSAKILVWTMPWTSCVYLSHSTTRGQWGMLMTHICWDTKWTSCPGWVGSERETEIGIGRPFCISHSICEHVLIEKKLTKETGN